MSAHQAVDVVQLQLLEVGEHLARSKASHSKRLLLGALREPPVQCGSDPPPRLRLGNVPQMEEIKEKWVGSAARAPSSLHFRNIVFENLHFLHLSSKFLDLRRHYILCGRPYLLL